MLKENINHFSIMLAKDESFIKAAAQLGISQSAHV
jgi:DNA-binding transcriptional LysR family regulator